MIATYTTAPALGQFDNEKEVIIEKDDSYYVSAGVLSQLNHEGVVHPVSYYLNKHLPPECNYDINDKEFMANTKPLEVWRPECGGAACP